MSEMNMVEVAAFSPTECVRCHAPQGPYLDVGVEVLGWGHVYLCDDCLAQGARLAGYADPAYRDSLDADNRRLTLELTEANAKLAPLEAGYAAFEQFKAAEAATMEALTVPVPEPEPLPEMAAPKAEKAEKAEPKKADTKADKPAAKPAPKASR